MAGPTTQPVVALMTGIAEYHLRLVAGMAEALARRSVPLLVVANEPFGTERTPSLVLDLIRRHIPRGVIALADASKLRQQELPAALARERVPTVTVGTKIEGAPRVHGDNEGGMRLLMRHVLDECGVRRPVLVRGVPHQHDSQTRERVFREEMVARGLEVDEGLVLDGAFRQQNSYEAMHDLLAVRRDFDAVVALNDPSALGVLAAAVDQGLRVPQDLLVTGFDNTEGSAESWPPMTTVDQGLAEQGRRAVELLLHLLDEPGRHDDVLVPSQLVVRTSTRVGDGVLSSTRPADLAALPGVRTVDGVPMIAVADLADRIEPVVGSAHALQRRVALQAAALSLNWTMANCRTVTDVIDALGSCLGRLGVRRCFLGIDHEATALGAVADGIDHPTRLALSYREGVAEPPSSEIFPRHELLPAPLRPELTDGGVLLLQALSIAERDRGYLLYEPVEESSLLTEALRIDLPRAVDTVLTSEALQNHAATLEHLVVERTRELEQANRELQQSVMRDGLTGIANRVAFQRYLERFTDSRLRPGEDLAMLMIDVDMFKAYNDLYGHLAGDEALKIVGECLVRSVREPRDLACRYGGEEFAVVLPDGGMPVAMAVAKRFRQLLARTAIRHEASTVAPLLTVSIGIAVTRLRVGFDPNDLVQSADQALYRAKVGGRNQIVTAGRRRPVLRRTPVPQGVAGGAEG